MLKKIRSIYNCVSSKLTTSFGVGWSSLITHTQLPIKFGHVIKHYSISSDGF
ncbi:hypothetical protein HanRHA438_Chr05g0213891 [Helianthus annuus]|nr:hypothetical protein HanRHA438_Chr05g0213891 [Helianthus annuus]